MWDVRLSPLAERWLNEHGDVVGDFNAWLAECLIFGPPDPLDCVVVEPDYEYRYLLEALAIRVDFIAVGEPERWMLITQVDSA